jgi:hypothetical protein
MSQKDILWSNGWEFETQTFGFVISRCVFIPILKGMSRDLLVPKILNMHARVEVFP